MLFRSRAKVEVLRADLTKKGITTHFDDRDNYKPGYKFAEYEMKGYPVRIAIGPKDLEKGTVEVARRDTLQKQSLPQENLADSIVKLLDEIQLNLFNKAVDFRTVNTTVVNNYDEFKKVIAEKGGFVLAHWDGTVETEQRIKEETKATIRCIPIDGDVEEGACILTGRPSKQRAIFAQAY